MNQDINRLDELPWNPQQDRRPLSDQVHDWLRLGIITLRFAPGLMLSESNLAQYLKVSRTPVREALIRLSQEGMVEILAQRGSRVAAIVRPAVEAARFVRLSLEQAIAKELCQKKIKPANFYELQAVIFQQREAAEQKNVETFMELDDVFHQKIAQAANREAAWNIIEQKKAQMDRVGFLSLKETADINVLIDQHEKILHAINEQQTEKTLELLEQHFAAVLQAMDILADMHPDYFDH